MDKDGREKMHRGLPFSTCAILHAIWTPISGGNSHIWFRCDVITLTSHQRAL